MMIQRRPSFSLLDDMFADPFFTHQDNKIMKTDIQKKDGKYLITIDLPGYSKEDIKINIEDGYLNVCAKITKENNEEDKESNYIRKERYCGECSRSFYIGKDVDFEDIKASFKNGTLCLEVKDYTDEVKSKSKQYIEIED